MPCARLRGIGSFPALAYKPRVQKPSSPRRLDQLLSACGYCSRSESRLWVRGGRVQVNGQPAESSDQKVRAEEVRVDGEPVDSPEGILVLLHKPAGYVCSREEREGPRVFDLLPPRWLPVPRPATVREAQHRTASSRDQPPIRKMFPPHVGHCRGVSRRSSVIASPSGRAI